MKKSFILSILVLLTASVFAQSPEKMSYQAVVRDGGGLLVKNGPVGMQISILQGSAVGMAVYVETQAPTSNDNGLVGIEIGDGAVVSGNFSTIDWSAGPYFIKTETDPAGGTNYTVIGTSQLLSVPYAMYANTADHAINDAVDDADSDPNNEIQMLSKTGNTVTLSNGGGTFQDEVGEYYAGDGIIMDNDTLKLAAPNVENLTMVQGTFNTQASILSGEGYTIVRDSVGHYRLTFDNSFSDFPAITYSTNFSTNLVLTNSMSYGWATIIVRNSQTGAVVNPNAWISFIAVGPKR